MPKSVSVLIPVYNAGEPLIAALDSALAQQGCDLELVLVDDGSTCQRTRQIIADYEDRITAYRKPNSGPANTRNVCLQKASHDWIAWLDQDDIWQPGKLAAQLQRAEETGAEVVYTNAELFGEMEDIGRFRNDPAAMPEGDVYQRLILDNFITTSAVMMKKHLPLNVGGHDPNVAGVDDWDMWLKVAATGAKFAAVPKPLCLYRWHSMSMSKQHNRMKVLRETVLRQAVASERGQQLPWQIRRETLATVTATSAWFISTANSKQAAIWYRDALVHWPFRWETWRGFLKSTIQSVQHAAANHRPSHAATRRSQARSPKPVHLFGYLKPESQN